MSGWQAKSVETKRRAELQARVSVHLLKDGNTACGRVWSVDSELPGWPMNYKVTSLLTKVTCVECLEACGRKQPLYESQPKEKVQG